jgi:hypothetical protein
VSSIDKYVTLVAERLNSDLKEEKTPLENSPSILFEGRPKKMTTKLLSTTV